MTASSTLSALQNDLLHAFVSRTPDFFLTGGGALAGFYLGHRTTEDLDLFTVPGVDLDGGVSALRSACDEVGAELSAVHHTPDFRRFAVARGEELTVVDLVVDRAPQVVREKPTLHGVRVDPLREIAANKVCALLGRTAPRDLVDLRALLAHGIELEDALRDAQVKDAAADAATLAWVLERYAISHRIAVPAGQDVDELDRFRRELVSRLTKLALPEG